MRQKVKITLDVLMTALLVVLMAYPVTEQEVHEWVGAGMLLLFLAHHVLNLHWLKALGKGKYNGRRILRTVVDVLLLADMLALMFSGIRLSRYVFTFLPGLGSAATARRLHMLASYWGFVLMSVHLGLHWGMVTAPLRRRLGGKAGALPRCVGAAVGLYGAYAAWTHQIWQYLTLRSEFIQFDFDRPGALYFWDHLCMMVLFALLAYTAAALVRKPGKGAGQL